MAMQVLRLRVLLFPDAQVGRPAIDVGRHVHAALLLGQRDAARVPAVGELARRVGDGQSEVVAQLRTGDALRLIFLVAGLPDAGEIGSGLRVARTLSRQRAHAAAAGRTLSRFNSFRFPVESADTTMNPHGPLTSARANSPEHYHGLLISELAPIADTIATRE